MGGRRLRHVNAEKKIEELVGGGEGEEVGESGGGFLKKNAKCVKQKGGGDGADKYVEKYSKDSAKCMEDVEKLVRESLSRAFSKWKGVEGEDGGAPKSKKLKICIGSAQADDHHT